MTRARQTKKRKPVRYEYGVWIPDDNRESAEDTLHAFKTAFIGFNPVVRRLPAKRGGK